MQAQFDFTAYLDSVNRAFDMTKSAYQLAFVVCAALVVFAIQGEPYKGSQKYLNYLTTTKASIDEMNGWIKGIEIVHGIRGIEHIGDVGEIIADTESEKLQLLANLYVEIKGIPDDETDKVDEMLSEGKLGEKEIFDLLTDELAKQYQYGVATGFSVPLLNVVVERERVPAFFSVLVAVFVALLAVSVGNFKHAFSLPQQSRKGRLD
jgi:hypothetical protein